MRTIFKQLTELEIRIYALEIYAGIRDENGERSQDYNDNDIHPGPERYEDKRGA